MTAQAQPSELPGGATKEAEKEAEAPGATGPVKKQRPPGFTPEGRIGSEGKVLNVFSHGMLVVWALLVTLPLLWAVMSSFKTDKEIFTSPWGLPSSLHFDNWSRAWSKSHIGDYFLHTVLVVGCS
ncbi:carbohydrate ABC transporter permease, partial [Streptomyces sp. MCAF7]